LIAAQHSLIVFKNRLNRLGVFPHVLSFWAMSRPPGAVNCLSGEAQQSEDGSASAGCYVLDVVSRRILNGIPIPRLISKALFLF
jgi:hypothetical protein